MEHFDCTAASGHRPCHRFHSSNLCNILSAHSCNPVGDTFTILQKGFRYGIYGEHNIADNYGILCNYRSTGNWNRIVHAKPRDYCDTPANQIQLQWIPWRIRYHRNKFEIDFLASQRFCSNPGFQSVNKNFFHFSHMMIEINWDFVLRYMLDVIEIYHNKLRICPIVWSFSIILSLFAELAVCYTINNWRKIFFGFI